MKKESQSVGESLIQEVQGIFDRLSKNDSEVEEILDVMGNSLSRQVEKKLQ